MLLPCVEVQAAMVGSPTFWRVYDRHHCLLSTRGTYYDYYYSLVRPFMPWPPAMSIFLNVFLMTTLKILSFQRFAIWACLITIFYVLYGVHNTYEAEETENEVDSSVNNLHTKVEIIQVH